MDLSDFRIHHGSALHLDKISTRAPDSASKELMVPQTAAVLQQLPALQEQLWAEHKHRLLVVLQATDTGGKDGTIRRVLSPLNPQGVRVASFKAPTEIELAHDFLWRAHLEVPENGEIVIFNRSHYEDVLIVRVRNLVPEKQWRARYEHIRNFERLLTDEGTTIVKFFLHISKDQQKIRLQSRLDDPTKRWKFNSADLVERAKWDDYRAAFEDAITETTSDTAPWYVIPADQKWYRDHIVASVLAETLKKLNMSWPSGADDLPTTIIN